MAKKKIKMEDGTQNIVTDVNKVTENVGDILTDVANTAVETAKEAVEAGVKEVTETIIEEIVDVVEDIIHDVADWIKGLFSHNPDVTELHATSDKQAFPNKNDAENHAKMLANNEIVPHYREEYFPTAVQAEDEEEEFEQETNV